MVRVIFCSTITLAGAVAAPSKMQLSATTQFPESGGTHLPGPSKHRENSDVSFPGSVAVDVMNKITDKDFLTDVKYKSILFSKIFDTWKKELSCIKEIRIEGLMIGIEFTNKIDTALIKEKALSKGLIINNIGNNILRLLPPLIISKKEIKECTDTLLKRVKSELK